MGSETCPGIRCLCGLVWDDPALSTWGWFLTRFGIGKLDELDAKNAN